MNAIALFLGALAALAPVSCASAFESDIGPEQSLDGTPHYVPGGVDTLFGTPGYRGAGRLGGAHGDRDWRYAAPTSKSNPNTARPDDPSTYPKYNLYTGR